MALISVNISISLYLHIYNDTMIQWYNDHRYGKYSSQLVAKGYRVARVEQTETPDMLAIRNKKSAGAKAKVVAREMCSIMSKGTRTYCHLDDLSLLEGGNANKMENSSVLMCIAEVLIQPTVVEGKICMNYVWITYELCMNYVWITYELCMK